MSHHRVKTRKVRNIYRFLCEHSLLDLLANPILTLDPLTGGPLNAVCREKLLAYQGFMENTDLNPHLKWLRNLSLACIYNNNKELLIEESVNNFITNFNYSPNPGYMETIIKKYNEEKDILRDLEGEFDFSGMKRNYCGRIIKLHTSDKRYSGKNLIVHEITVKLPNNCAHQAPKTNIQSETTPKSIGDSEIYLSKYLDYYQYSLSNFLCRYSVVDKNSLEGVKPSSGLNIKETRDKLSKIGEQDCQIIVFKNKLEELIVSKFSNIKSCNLVGDIDLYLHCTTELPKGGNGKYDHQWENIISVPPIYFFRDLNNYYPEGLIKTNKKFYIISSKVREFSSVRSFSDNIDRIKQELTPFTLLEILKRNPKDHDLIMDSDIRPKYFRADYTGGRVKEMFKLFCIGEDDRSENHGS